MSSVDPISPAQEERLISLVNVAKALYDAAYGIRERDPDAIIYMSVVDQWRMAQDNVESYVQHLTKDREYWQHLTKDREDWMAQ